MSGNEIWDLIVRGSEGGIGVVILAALFYYLGPCVLGELNQVFRTTVTVVLAVVPPGIVFLLRSRQGGF